MAVTSETKKPNDHLELGDLYVIETGNDLMKEIEALKMAQKDPSKSKYEKEQIAWNVLTLRRRLNDTNIDDLKTRAQAEKTRTNDTNPNSELNKFITSVEELKQNMSAVRAQEDIASRKARVSFLSQFDQMRAVAGMKVAGKEAETIVPMSDIPVVTPITEATAASKPLSDTEDKGPEKNTPKKVKKNPPKVAEKQNPPAVKSNVDTSKITDIDREARGVKAEKKADTMPPATLAETPAKQEKNIPQVKQSVASVLLGQKWFARVEGNPNTFKRWDHEITISPQGTLSDNKGRKGTADEKLLILELANSLKEEK